MWSARTRSNNTRYVFNQDLIYVPECDESSVSVVIEDPKIINIMYG